MDGGMEHDPVHLMRSVLNVETAQVVLHDHARWLGNAPTPHLDSLRPNAHEQLRRWGQAE